MRAELFEFAIVDVMLGAPGRFGVKKAAELGESGDVPTALVAEIANR